jgi:hypothetical protein
MSDSNVVQIPEAQLRDADELDCFASFAMTGRGALSIRV